MASENHNSTVSSDISLEPEDDTLFPDYPTHNLIPDDPTISTPVTSPGSLIHSSDDYFYMINGALLGIFFIVMVTILMTAIHKRAKIDKTVDNEEEETVKSSIVSPSPQKLDGQQTKETQLSPQA